MGYVCEIATKNQKSMAKGSEKHRHSYLSNRATWVGNVQGSGCGIVFLQFEAKEIERKGEERREEEKAQVTAWTKCVTALERLVQSPPDACDKSRTQTFEYHVTCSKLHPGFQNRRAFSWRAVSSFSADFITGVYIVFYRQWRRLRHRDLSSWSKRTHEMLLGREPSQHEMRSYVGIQTGDRAQLQSSHCRKATTGFLLSLLGWTWE